MLIENIPFVVVDVETTGLSPRDSAITEIAMVKVVGGKICDEYSTLVNPEMSIPYSITELTGIDDDLVHDAPTAKEIAPTIISFLEDGVFTAHNVAFDLGFVNSTISRGKIPPISNRQLCTCKFARKLLPHLKSKALGVVTRELGIRHTHRHRAAGDAYATAQVLIYFLKVLDEQFGINEFDDLFRYQ